MSLLSIVVSVIYHPTLWHQQSLFFLTLPFSQVVNFMSPLEKFWLSVGTTIFEAVVQQSKMPEVKCSFRSHCTEYNTLNTLHFNQQSTTLPAKATGYHAESNISEFIFS